MNFNLHFGELHSDISINDKNNLFENYKPKFYKVKRILISFNCFSEYINKGIPIVRLKYFFGTKFKLSVNLTAIERYSGLGIYLTLRHWHKRLVE